MLDGFSQEELRAIGERKSNLNLAIQPSDINRTVSYAQSQQQIAAMQGASETLLRNISDRKGGGLPSTRTAQAINERQLPINGEVDAIMDTLANKWGIRKR